MTLVPEQISLLREEYRREMERLKKYEENTKGNCLLETEKLIEIKKILRSHDFLKIRTIEKIAVGTKFTIKIFGEELQEVMLVDKNIDLLDKCNTKFIYKESPLGQMLVGKKTTDFIEKKSTNGNSIVVGIVKGIKTDSDEYIHFIRERKPDHRRSREELRNLRILKRKSSYSRAAKEELENKKMITASQLNLLKEESSRLMAKPFRTPAENGRLTQIKKLLSTLRVALLPEDDTIGIGTCFSIKISTPKGVITKRVEMINQAVSDELSNEYVEKIGPMGIRLFGLKEGDRFDYFSSQLGHISGVVFDIDNIQNQIKTSDALFYQNKNCRKSGLVAEQVEMLEAELAYKTNILNIRKNELAAGYCSSIDQDIKTLKQRIEEISHLLTSEKIIENPNTDMIDVGSKVSLSLNFQDGEIEEMDATVVSRFVSHEASSNEFITMEQALGDAIYGKKEGEQFSYSLPTGLNVTGEVKAIRKQETLMKNAMVKGK